jgi:hypothetical protein
MGGKEKHLHGITNSSIIDEPEGTENNRGNTGFY